MHRHMDRDAGTTLRTLAALWSPGTCSAGVVGARWPSCTPGPPRTLHKVTTERRCAGWSRLLQHQPRWEHPSRSRHSGDGQRGIAAPRSGSICSRGGPPHAAVILPELRHHWGSSAPAQQDGDSSQRHVLVGSIRGIAGDHKAPVLSLSPRIPLLGVRISSPLVLQGCGFAGGGRGWEIHVHRQDLGGITPSLCRGTCCCQIPQHCSPHSPQKPQP